MKNIINLEVDENSTLLIYLIKNIKNKSKNNIKTFLTKGNVLVNNQVVTKHDYKLKKGDKIIVRMSKINNKIKDINILYEDDDFIVVNKPSNLLCVATNKEKNKTLYHLVREHIKKYNKNNKIFIVHRLDKDTSGLVLFAKNEKIKRLLQEDWNKLVDRRYLALVEGYVEKEKDTIISFLQETKDMHVYSSTSGKKASTTYKRIKANRKYSLLEIKINTGRKNQIRVHLSDISHPIVGDKKYNAKTNPVNRLCLHAYSLKFINPINNKKYFFKTEEPKEIINLIK